MQEEVTQRTVALCVAVSYTHLDVYKRQPLVTEGFQGPFQNAISTDGG